MSSKCVHANISHATSSDMQSVCADCGSEVVVDQVAIIAEVIRRELFDDDADYHDAAFDCAVEIAKRLTAAQEVRDAIPD